MDLNHTIKAFFQNDSTVMLFKQKLAELIKIPSVSAQAEGEYIFGRDSADALSCVCKIAEEFGFQSTNHDWRLVDAFLPGTGNDEIGIICHADVVPAAADWRFPPFELTEHNGLLIGRGIMDDKGPLMLSLFAMKFFIDNHIVLPFGLRLIVGGSEEVGVGDINYYLETGHKPPRFSFTPDSEFPVCCAEKGIATFEMTFPALGSDILSFQAGTVSNAVPDYAYCILNVGADAKLPSCDRITVSSENGMCKIEAHGIAAHAAMPENSLNAIVLLARYLTDNQLVTSPESANAMNYILTSASDAYGEGLGIDCNDEVSGKLTCIIGIARSSESGFTVNHNIRYPQTFSFENQIEPRLKAVSEKFRAQYKRCYHSEGYAYSPDLPEIKALTEAFAMVTGKNLPPYATGGGTYARAFPNTVAFGPESDMSVSPMGQGRGGIHQSDECTTLDYLMECGEIYTTAIAHLAGLL